MGWYAEQVVPRFINASLGSKRFVPMRQRVTSGLSSEIVEIGFGSGLNVPYYPSDVRTVKAIDPSAVGQKLAASRVAASSAHIDYVGLDVAVAIGTSTWRLTSSNIASPFLSPGPR